MVKKGDKDKAKRFAEEYVKAGFVAAIAYRAIASKQDVTAGTARVEGCRWLAREDVQQHVKELTKSLSDSIGITVERQILRLDDLYQEAVQVRDKISILQEQSKLLDLYAAQKVENTNTNLNLNANDPKFDARVGAVRAAIKQLTGKSGSSK